MRVFLHLIVPNILLILFFSFPACLHAGQIYIEASIDKGPWKRTKALYPLSGQDIRLRVKPVEGAKIRWYEIRPDTSKYYKNANFPWDPDPYKWAGLAVISYDTKHIEGQEGLWEISLNRVLKKNIHTEEETLGARLRNLPGLKKSSPEVRSVTAALPAGSYWFQAVLYTPEGVLKTPGVEDNDRFGLSPNVLRVSIRSTEGYTGYLSTFFNVPGLFGSTTYQSFNYIGVDCADVLMAAHARWKSINLDKNYNVASLVSGLRKISEFNLHSGTPDKKVRFGLEVKEGDFIAVRYPGRRAYQHIGALYEDKNQDGLLGPGDTVLHAGPHPLRVSTLSEGGFDGHVVILRP